MNAHSSQQTPARSHMLQVETDSKLAMSEIPKAEEVQNRKRCFVRHTEKPHAKQDAKLKAGPRCVVCGKGMGIKVHTKWRNADGWTIIKSQWRCRDNRCKDMRRECEICGQMKDPSEYPRRDRNSCKSCTRPTCANEECVCGKAGGRYGDEDHKKSVDAHSKGWIDHKWYCPWCRPQKDGPKA